MHQISGEQPRNHDERQHRRKFQKSGQRSNEPKSSENPGKRGKHIKVLNRAECAAKACRTTPLPQVRLKKHNSTVWTGQNLPLVLKYRMVQKRMKIDTDQAPTKYFYLLSSIARRQKVLDLLDSAVCVCAAKLHDEANSNGADVR